MPSTEALTLTSYLCELQNEFTNFNIGLNIEFKKFEIHFVIHKDMMLVLVASYR